MNKIKILSGEIRTGKTTKLMQWSLTKKNIDGIFQPVIEGKRFIYHISSRTLKILETEGNENITAIGNYKFSNQTFLWAQNILTESVKNNLDWLVIDEIGPLELKGKGLEPAVTNILSSRKNISTNILCVVRKSILNDFIEHYNLADEYELFEIE